MLPKKKEVIRDEKFEKIRDRRLELIDELDMA